MRIVHIHLLGPYTDNWGYQENILPKIQSLQGHDVTVIASCFSHLPDNSIQLVNNGDYVDSGVRIIRLENKKHFHNAKINNALFCYPLYRCLCDLNPDVILVHGLGLGMMNFEIRKFIRSHSNCVLYGDSHALEENQSFSKSGLKSSLIAGFYSYSRRILYPYYKKVFGVTPKCVEYAIDKLKVPRELTDLLPLGFDPTYCCLSNRDSVRSTFRKKIGVNESDILIVHGGKIIPRRKTDVAIKTFSVLKEKYQNIKLLVFGDIVNEIKEEIMSLISSDSNIIYLGHLTQKEYINVLLSSDFAFFPGAQSALWQEAIGCGLPLVLGYTEGIEYLNVNDNVIFVEKGNVSDSVDKISQLLEDNKLVSMKINACSKAREFFSYDRIAKYMLMEQL